MTYQLPDTGISLAQKKLQGALHLTGTQATRADVDALDLAVDHSTDTLDIWLPLALSLQMGVADIIAAQLAFCTDFANTCHAIHLLNCTEDIFPIRNGNILAQAIISCK